MTHGLPPETVNKIHGVLAQHAKVQRAVIYGSRAKGNYKPGSDIDLTLFAVEGQEIDYREVADILDEIDDLLLPYTVDLSAFEQLNHVKLREHIERVGKVFYEREGAGEYSGVAMKAGWAIKPLGELCEVFADGDWVESKDQSTEGIRLIQTGNVGEGAFKDRAEKARYISEETFKRLRCTEIFEGDCLISRLPDPVGRSAILPDTGERMITAVDCTIVRFDLKQCLPTFFNYYSQSTDYLNTIAKECTGTTRSRISRSNLALTPIPVPPLSEQHRIVAILDDAFDGIATAKANAEKNLQNARALFESHLQSVFTERGEGWVETTIGEVAEVFDGPHATPKTIDVGPIFLGISALQDGQIDLRETRHVTPEDFRQWTRRVKPQVDDVVFSYETRLGQAAIIPPGLECCLGRRMGLVRPNRERLDPRFFVYQYISPPFRTFLESRTVRGATVDRIALKEFPSFPIKLPSLEKQKRLASLFEALRAETQHLESLYQQKLTALDDLKKSLLHQAFSGEL